MYQQRCDFVQNVNDFARGLAAHVGGCLLGRHLIVVVVVGVFADLESGVLLVRRRGRGC
jgi:hypothetical protein